MSPFLLLLIGMAVVISSMLVFRLHAFIALLLGALVVAALTPVEAITQFALGQGMSPAEAAQFAQVPLAERIARGFGRTVTQIGIVIAMASVIGACLLESGAADRIVRGALRLLGEKRSGPAFAGSGFVLAIPVFFDTVFYLMVPLAKMIRMRTGKNYLLYILSVVAGGTMAHSLVPPTPGPLFMASELGVDMGVMIVGGLIFGLLTSTSGYYFARWANARWELPLRETETALQQLQELSQRETHRLPRLWLSLLPILLPLVLITGSTLLALVGIQAGPDVPAWQAWLLSGAHIFGEKNMALILGAALAMAIMLRDASLDQMGTAIKGALGSAGVIILIIGAGGAFGSTLQQTGIGTAIESLAAGQQAAILPMAFVLTVLVRTAQGSATVAMITAAGAFAGVAAEGHLNFHPLYIAMVIGCGSKLIWWMNDSGFWIVSQMSGMTEREALKYLTPINAIMGTVGLIAVMIAAALFPLV